MAIHYGGIGVGFAVAGYAGQPPDGVRFRAVLTGAADGLPDMALPISKIYARTYSGQASEHQVSVPYTPEIAADIQARPGGSVRVFREARDSISGASGEALAFDFPVDKPNYYRGPYSATYVLAGSRQTTNSTPLTVAVDKLFEEGMDFNGGRTWRVPAFYAVRPGDSAVIDGETVVIDRVQFHATASDAYLTLREVA